MNNATQDVISAPSNARSASLTVLEGKSLAYCVGDVAQFMEQAWGKAPVLNQGKAEKFSQLFSIGELSQLISLKAIPASDITALKDGRGVPHHLLTEAGHSEGDTTFPADIVRVRALVRRGFTLQINKIQRFSACISRLCQSLESELSYNVNAAVFHTPSSSQGLLPHYDDSDKIVLQIEGRKDWLIFDKPGEGSAHSHGVRLTDDAEPLLKTTLTAGQSVYIPRGFVHCAAATDQHSLHITISLHPPTVADLVTQAVSELANSPAFARSLDPGFARRSDEVAEALVQAAEYLRERLREPGSADQSAEAFCRPWQRLVADLRE